MGSRKMKLTKSAVESEPLPAQDETVLWDTVLGGFHVRVRSTGRRVYFVWYRGPGGRERRPRIGEHGAVTLDQARDVARRLLGEVAAGDDPSVKRRAAREQSLTLAQFFEDTYLPRMGDRWKPRSKDGFKALWTNQIEPSLGTIPLDKITKRDVFRMHEKVSRTHKVAANRAASLLRAVLGRAKAWGHLAGENPASGLEMNPEASREAHLSGSQLRAIIAAIAAEEALFGPRAIDRTGKASGRGGKGMKEEASRGISPACASLFRLLIFTGCRLREIMNAEWAWIDLDAEALDLPDKASKTGAKRVWLNSLAMVEIRKLRERSPAGGTYLIEGRVDGRPLVNPTKPWHRVRAAAAKMLKGQKLKEEAAGVGTVRLHDLRHSWASFGVVEGVPLYVVGKTLGHANARTTERYAHVADDPAKAAAERIGLALQREIDAVPATVVPLVTPPAADAESKGG